MSYYVNPTGRTATFTLSKRFEKEKLVEVSGNLKGFQPVELKKPPPGYPPHYPSYEIITVKGITEAIEHRQMEPIFYVTDNPAVLAELGISHAN